MPYWRQRPLVQQGSSSRGAAAAAWQGSGAAAAGQLTKGRGQGRVLLRVVPCPFWRLTVQGLVLQVGAVGVLPWVLPWHGVGVLLVVHTESGATSYLWLLLVALDCAACLPCSKTEQKLTLPKWCGLCK